MVIVTFEYIVFKNDVTGSKNVTCLLSVYFLRRQTVIGILSDEMTKPPPPHHVINYT